MGAFVPLMENGGGGNHFPWVFDNGTGTETTDIYRNFVNIHYELKPYFLSSAATAYETGVSVIFPMADSVVYPYHSYDYLLWKDIFVAPIVESGLQRQIDFPSGNNWVYWFNSSRIYVGGTEVNLTIPMDEFPAFSRAGSMLPLHVDTNGPHGDLNANGYLTILIHALKGYQEKIVVRRWKDVSSELSYFWNDSSFTFTATASNQGIILLLNGISQCPDKIQENVYLSEIPKLPTKHHLNSQKWGYYCDEQHLQLYVMAGDHAMFGVDLAIYGLETLYF